MSEIKVEFNRLRKIIGDKLVSVGLNEVNATSVADCLATADLYGVSTHGTMVLPSYIKMIKEKRFNTNEEIKLVSEGVSFAVFDADNAIGIISAKKCVLYAMEQAESKGIFTVFSRNSNTYGPAFYYVLNAAKKGFIAVSCCNAPAAMTSPNGKEKILGTNPFAVAVPSKKYEPVVLDMASSVVAKSKINQMRIEGDLIPEGWALDENGKPTNNPEEAIKGFINPLSGFKGYGIAMMIDIFAGLLSGAAYLNDVGKFYSQDNTCMNVGHMFTIINPRIVFGNKFYEQMDEYVERIRGIQKVNEDSVIPLPGDDRIKNKKDNSNGITISSDIYELLTT